MLLLVYFLRLEGSGLFFWFYEQLRAQLWFLGSRENLRDEISSGDFAPAEDPAVDLPVMLHGK